MRGLIAPALAHDQVVILDRYFPSMVAYQGAAGLATDALLEANAFAPRPDVLLILDLPPSEGLARIRARGDKPNAFDGEENLTACRRIFLDLPMPKHVLDATQPIESVLADAQVRILLAIAEKMRREYGTTPAAVAHISSFLPVLAG